MENPLLHLPHGRVPLGFLERENLRVQGVDRRAINLTALHETVQLGDQTSAFGFGRLNLRPFGERGGVITALRRRPCLLRREPIERLRETLFASHIDRLEFGEQIAQYLFRAGLRLHGARPD